MVLPLSFAEIAYPQKDPYRNAPGNFWLTVMGRLQPERSIKTAQSNLQAILPQVYAEADPQGRFLNGYFKSFTLGVESGRAGRSALRIGYSRPLILLELLSALLLTLCCTNIALLVLARVSGRQHEFALRSALGASNSRLIGQVLLESVSFVPLGLIAGLVVGAALARALAAMLGGIGSPSTLDASLNPTVLIFSAGIALATALLAGLWPALRVRRLAPAANIRHGNYSARSSMTGSWIIPVQVAISVTLLVSALLLGSTFARLYLEPSGFQGRQLVFADVDISAAKLNADHSSQVVEALLAGLRSSPGIESAAARSPRSMVRQSSTNACWNGQKLFLSLQSTSAGCRTSSVSVLRLARRAVSSPGPNSYSNAKGTAERSWPRASALTRHTSASYRASAVRDPKSRSTWRRRSSMTRSVLSRVAVNTPPTSPLSSRIGLYE